MTRPELINAIAEKTEISKKNIDAVLRAFTETVTEVLQDGDKVQITGFGTFETSERPGREGRNPQTGESVTIAACRVPRFKAGKTLKEAVH